MAMRVATFANSQQMIAAALRTQATMTELQLQESSGVMSTDFGGYGAKSQQIIDLQVSVSRAQSYIDTATQVGSKVEVMYSAVNSIADLLAEFRSTLTAATNSNSVDTTTIKQSASDMMQQMAALLNTQYGGKYVFGGARTDTKPVDVSSVAYPAMTSPSSASKSYYQGDHELASTRVCDDQTVPMGDYFDLVADLAGLARPLRLSRAEATRQLSPMQMSFLSESRRLRNQRLKTELRLQLRYPTVREAFAAQA